MRTAIMQPTYLPWPGYFHMIRNVDLFTFLDDVQFAKRSWQQRNRIMLNGTEHFLTIPVKSKGKRDQLIFEVVVDDDQHWREKHKNTLNHAYHKHPFGGDVVELISDCLDRCGDNLSDINIAIIDGFCNELDITTPLQRSSNIPVNGIKSGYLVALCRYCKALSYLSARGSKEYIEEEALFSEAGLHVDYHDFVSAPYRQQGAKEFIPYLSIVDVVANIGFEDAKKMMEGRLS